MAVVTLLDSFSTTTDASTAVSESLSPAADAMLVCVVISNQGNPGPGTHGITPGGTLAFTATEVGTQTWRNQSTFETKRMTSWVGPTGASPGTGTITFTRGGIAQGSWVFFIYQIEGAVDSGAATALLQNEPVNSANTDVVTLDVGFDAAIEASGNSVAITVGVVDDEAAATLTLSVTSTASTQEQTASGPAQTARGFVENPTQNQEATVDSSASDTMAAWRFEIETEASSSHVMIREPLRAQR
jgi:hypothetical protein